MKFLQFIALQKVLRSSSSQIPRCYLVIHSQREERRRVLEKVSEEIARSYQKKTSTVWLEGDSISWGRVKNTLLTPSLFEEEEIVIWNGVDKVDLEDLAHYVANPSSKAFFLMGVEQFKSFAELYQKNQKHLVLLDLSEEKPWEKEKRLQQEVLQMAKEASKTISPEALTTLFSLCPPESLIVEQEFSKLASYVGARKEIIEQDVLSIVSGSLTSTGWQLSDALVFGETLSFPRASIDLSFFLAFCGQVRFSLQQGRQLGWCLQNKMRPDEISKVMPNLKPAQMQKITHVLRLRKMKYFDQALADLYDMELLGKNSNLSPPVLFDLLQNKLTHLKQTLTR